MKKTLLCILLFPVFLYAQNTFDQSYLWSIMKGPATCLDSENSNFYSKIIGDTIIQDLNYQIVWNSADSAMIDKTLEGFIREEDQKVFLLKKDSNNECLLYDFAASVGDTLSLGCWCQQEYNTFVVDSIVDLQVNEVSRKHYFLSYQNNEANLIWIEGIGSPAGLLNGAKSICMTGFYEQLLCCYIDGELAYSKSGCPCNLQTSITEDIPTNDIYSIFPNPAQESLFIDLCDQDQYLAKAKVLSFNGQILKSFTFNNTDSPYELNVDLLKPGVYFIQMEIGNEIYTEKVIIEN